MENRKKFWMTGAPGRWLPVILLLLIWIVINIYHLYALNFCELIILWMITRATVPVFSQLSLSLPFSRRELWKRHAVIQTVGVWGFGLMKLVFCRESLIESVCVLMGLLMVYFAQAKLPKENGASIGPVAMYLVVFYLCLYVEIYHKQYILPWNGVNAAVLGLIFVLGITWDIRYWKKQKAMFIQGKREDHIYA